MVRTAGKAAHVAQLEVVGGMRRGTDAGAPIPDGARRYHGAQVGGHRVHGIPLL